MSDSTPVAPGTSPAASSAPGASSAAVGSGEASAVLGNAPGGGDDAAAVAAGAGQAPPTPAEFLFRGRSFRDQKHAEEVFGSEVERVRGVQRQNAELQNQLNQTMAELQTLRAVVAGGNGNGQGQGSPQDRQGPAGPPSPLDAFLKPESFAVYQEIAEDPRMGVGHALLAQAQDMVSAVRQEMDSRDERFQAMLEGRDLRGQQERAVVNAIGATQKLKEQFPELDNDNKSPEAAEAQQEILAILRDTPPVETPKGPVPLGIVWLAQQPEMALRFAASRYRETYGTPVFAQPPGTSGSPSSRAAAAAEAAAGATTAVPLDGTGVPRPRTGGPETFVDRVKRETREADTTLKTPGGRSLGFSAA